MKNTPKHEPTLSYFHLVECLRKCMMKSDENNHHVHNGYGKGMASSSDVKDTDEDKDKDESNNSIARSFDEHSAENIESESDCNIVNATTEFNCDKHIKPSANVIEASYSNIFECRRNVLDKLDVTYQSAFAASEKQSPPAAAHISPLKKILHAIIGSQKPSTPSPVAQAADYASPLKQQYWDVVTNNLIKQMVGMDEDYILDAIYILRNENPEYHEGIINHLINEYDDFSQYCEGDTDSAESEEIKGLLKEIE